MTHDTLPPEPSLPEQVPTLYTGERLSDETIDTINQHYDIEVHVGRHGTGRANHKYGHGGAFSMPTQAEYAATEAVATSLRPGDMLFVEGKGYTAETEHYGFTAEQGRSLADDYQTDTFTHAMITAAAKGVTPHRADLNASEWQEVETALGKPFTKLDLKDAADAAAFKAVDIQRERAASHKVVDAALRQLSDLAEQQQDPGTEAGKRRLVLLFGTHHKAGLQEAFDELGLTATVHELHRSTPEERKTEHIRFAASLAIRSLLGQ